MRWRRAVGVRGQDPYHAAMETTFRAAQRDDATAILAFWIRCEANPSSTDDVKSLQRLVAQDGGALILAEEEGRIIGTVIAGWDGWRGSIYRLSVDPSSRRRGLGRELVRCAEERLTHLGAVRLGALVLREDQQAMDFWRSAEWEQQPDILRFTKG